MKLPELAIQEASAEAEAGAPQQIREPGFFSRFFQAEWPRLRNYLSRFVGSEEAEDIAQEAFTRIYAAPGEIRSPSGLLYQTARNVMIDRRRRRKVAGLFLVEDDAAATVPDLRASPEEQVELRQRLERAAVMLESMPPKCRKIFLLQVIDGYTYAEIAGQMGISVVGVKKQLLRAFQICAAHAEAEERRSGKRGQRPKRTRDEKK
jgi:RNA polymerase sigma-70 factor (ECF subfamily)